MAFRSITVMPSMVKFNSATSSDFLDRYLSILDDVAVGDNQGPKHKTFAPSQMRCDRISWFRLRGVQPDRSLPDRGLQFTADMGSACHEIIQKNLVDYLQNDWIPVSKWVADNPEKFIDYDMDLKKNGYEWLIEITHPYPVRFACDGIVRFKDKIYLLEIKTAEYSSLQDLIEPKPKHIDQVKCYSMLMQIPDVLFLYQDRQHGDLKCFELHVSKSDIEELKARMNNVMHLADVCIAPEGLPKGDPDCSPSMCDYYAKCKEWGR